MNYDKIMFYRQLMAQARFDSYYSILYQNTISFTTSLNHIHDGIELTFYYPKLDKRSKYIEI